MLYGKRLSLDMDEIRQDMGVCPQHDILYDKSVSSCFSLVPPLCFSVMGLARLTVEEHLYLVAGIKAVPRREAEDRVTRLLQDVDLQVSCMSCPTAVQVFSCP